MRSKQWNPADYYLATGGGVEASPNRGLLRHGRIRLTVQREQGVATRAGSAVNRALGGDGQFPPNPAIAAGIVCDSAFPGAKGSGPCNGGALASYGTAGMRFPAGCGCMGGRLSGWRAEL